MMPTHLLSQFCTLTATLPVVLKQEIFDLPSNNYLSKSTEQIIDKECREKKFSVSLYLQSNALYIHTALTAYPMTLNRHSSSFFDISIRLFLAK